jgi:two-component system, cell cycle sensor histidine kinase and response regulator CckA
MTYRGLTVLLIEDEHDVRQVLARALGSLELTVVEAPNGELGLSAARRLAGSLSLVVTDINMPVMSGLEFAREFRPLQPRVPVLFITGLDSRLTVQEARRFGSEVLLKPFGSDTFVNSVARVLDQSILPARSMA